MPCPVFARAIGHRQRHFLRKRNWASLTHLLACSLAVWPDWAMFYFLGGFLKPVVTIFSPICPHFWAIFHTVTFLLWKYFWATFYRHWATFTQAFWSPCSLAHERGGWEKRWNRLIALNGWWTLLHYLLLQLSLSHTLTYLLAATCSLSLFLSLSLSLSL